MYKFVDTSKKTAQKTFEENNSKSLIEVFKQGKHRLICSFYIFFNQETIFMSFIIISRN